MNDGDFKKHLRSVPVIAKAIDMDEAYVISAAALIRDVGFYPSQEEIAGLGDFALRYFYHRISVAGIDSIDNNLSRKLGLLAQQISIPTAEVKTLLKSIILDLVNKHL
jgi:hypothetical protein